MAFFNESTLTDSMIYKMFNNNQEMTTRLANALKTGEILPASSISEQLLQIKRTHISPLSDDVIKAFDEGKILLVYNNKIKVPQGIPFVIMKTANGNKAIIFVSNYGNLSKPDVEGKKYLNMSMKDIYVLMESSFIAYKYYEYPASIQKNAGLMKFCCSVYTSMLMRILNKEYALSLDQNLYNSVSFSISKFFLENIWELQNKDLVNAYASSGLNNINRVDLKLTEDKYETSKIQNISELIAFIQLLSPRLKTLNIRYFVEAYMNTFKPSAIISIDCLPYFIYVMIATFIGSFIVNQPIINDIIKNTKGSNIFYSELSKIVS